MKSHLRSAILVLAVLSFGASLAMPTDRVAMALRVVTAAVVLVSVWRASSSLHSRRSLRDRVFSPDPWTLFGASLLLRTAADASMLAGKGTVNEVFIVVATVGAVLATGSGLLQMMRQRFGDRCSDYVTEAVIAAATGGLIAWVTVIEPTLRTSHLETSRGIAGIVGITLAMVMASAALFLRGSFTTRPLSITLLAFSQVVAVGIALLSFVASAGNHPLLDTIATALIPIFALGLGLGAVDDSMGIYEEPTGPAGARLGRARLVGLILPVLIGPLLLTLCLTKVISLSPLAVATFTVLLSLLVVGHLLAMVQARASSTHWASHDKLTGLPNRALFRERTAQALERARKTGAGVAVLYLDLDRFKHINDSMGHEAGDQLLEQVARRIVACVDAGDTVARLGGDEFAILLPEVSDEGVPRKLARRLLKNFSSPFNLKPRPVFMSPSIGIAMNEGNAALETVLTHADTAMYRAKECGRNNFAVWSQDMNEAAKQRLMLETHLHSAISNDELRLAYQPKVELATGSVVGVEALIRWHHPKLGVISPDVFIHLAEESGLINQIGEWVLQTACRQGRIWYDSGFTSLTVAVNLSSRQFQQNDFSDQIAKTLRQSGLPPELLELELTESMAMSGEDDTLVTLHDLRQMGVKCSIDDFGTGYSNLSYLSRFPIDALKIDKAFIQQIDASDGDAALVVAIIAMAHGLGIKVIGEGVETPEQVAFLVEQGCDEMQGFLFSRPIPPEEIESLLMLEHVSGGSGRLGLSAQPTAAKEKVQRVRTLEPAVNGGRHNPFDSGPIPLPKERPASAAPAPAPVAPVREVPAAKAAPVAREISPVASPAPAPVAAVPTRPVTPAEPASANPAPRPAAPITSAVPPRPVAPVAPVASAPVAATPVAPTPAVRPPRFAAPETTPSAPVTPPRREPVVPPRARFAGTPKDVVDSELIDELEDDGEEFVGRHAAKKKP